MQCHEALKCFLLSKSNFSILFMAAPTFQSGLFFVPATAEFI
jgi:hypothetical protein